MNTSIDYYSLLGIKPAASADEIKRAYRKMVFRFHPDRNPGDVEAAGKFNEVIDAYAVLSDGLKRSTYDAIRHPAKAQEEPQVERDEEPPHRSEDGAGNGFGQGFTGQEFKGQQTKGAVEAEPKCPSCAVIGGEHVVSRRGGGAKSRGKQFVLAPFNIVFCAACGHVYGVTASAG